MPGFLLHAGAAVSCIHQGRATPTAVSARVRVSAMSIVTLPASYSVVGCPLSPNQGGPDTAGQWVTGAARVKSLGLPVLLFDSRANAVPTGTLLLVQATQTRVFGM